MREFTEKYNNTYKFNATQNAIAKMAEKMGKLEDVEEELGIDLITLFKALKKGFYYRAINAGYPNEIWFADPDNEDCGIECYNNNSYGITWASLGVAYTNNYGTTWALTPEELKNDSRD